MDPELHTILREHCDISQAGFSNYMTYYNPKQYWRTKTGEQGQLWNQYCDLAYRDTQDQNKNLCLAEVAGQHCPITALITLKYPATTGTPNISRYFVQALVYCYQQAILDFFQITPQQSELICCVLESDQPFLQNNNIVYQIRLQFPYCVTENQIQKQYIRPKAIDLARQHNFVSLLESQPVNNWDDIIDQSCLDNPLPLYRSNRSPEETKQSLVNIYRPIDFNSIEEEVIGLDLDHAFILNRHSHINQGLVNIATIQTNPNRDYWLPMFLSLHYEVVITQPRNRINTIRGDRPSSSNNRSPSFNSFNVGVEEQTDIDILHHLLPLLAVERSQKENSWKDVGKALFNIYNGSLDGLREWITFSNRGSKFGENDCSNWYYTFRENNPVSIKTIAWYAKQDSKEAYAQWHNDWCFPLMERALSLTHTDVAAALYRVYWLDFVCASLTENRWYQFQTNVWMKLDAGSNLRKEISAGFMKKFEIMRLGLSQRIVESNDDTYKSHAEIQIKKIVNLIAKLKCTTYKTALLKEATEHFHDEKFDKFVDTNSNLMATMNKVIEACDEEAIVRPGKPEDYINKCSAIYYPENYHWDHPDVKRFMEWMIMLFGITLANYVILLLAACIVSGNIEKLFPILTGSGDNGKSMFKKLCEAIFGSYCVTFPTSMVTGKRTNSSSATPELSQAAHSKMAWIQEPDKKEKLQAGIIKELTGSDGFFSRMLYGNGGRQEGSFTLFLMCNKVPLVPSADTAFKNRARLIPFLSKWVASGWPSTIEEQHRQRIYRMDRLFRNKISLYATAGIWVIVQKYAEYRRDGLQEPEDVKVATANYWARCDIYQTFAAECIERAIVPGSATPENPLGVQDVNAKLTLQEMFSEFKLWFKENCPSEEIPQREDFCEEMELRWGKMRGNGWYGVRTIRNVVDI